MKYERIYLSIAGGSATIYYRPAHQFIMCGETKLMVAQFKILLLLKTKDFYDFILAVPCIKIKRNVNGEPEREEEREKWYQGAWKQQTENILKDNHLTMIKEEVPWDYIDQVLKKSKSDKTFNRDKLSDNNSNNSNSNKDTNNKDTNNIVNKHVKKIKHSDTDSKKIIRHKKLKYIKHK